MSWGAVLFGALGLILQGLAALCAYEAYQIGSGKDATISKVVAYTLSENPIKYVVGVFIAGAVFGALLAHFSKWKV